MHFFDKLKITDVRNTCDIWQKYCYLQVANLSIGSASVGLEQPRDQHVQKMAPQQKKTASTKKIPAKKTSRKKTAPKKTGSKATVAMKTKKNTASKKTVARKAAPKKTVAKKASPTKTISKSSEERAERAARRSLSKEGPAAKRAKVDTSDLVNLTNVSPALLWLEGNWRRLSMEEKAVWRKMAEELANINKK